MSSERYKYKIEDVVDCSPPELAYRTYIEHQDTRKILADLGGKTLQRAAELGSGFGRMTVLLTEFADEVHGYEREPEFVNLSQKIVKEVKFHNVESLAEIPVSDGYFDLVMTFTVLQHIADANVVNVIREIKRITAPGGRVLLCEGVNQGLAKVDQSNGLHFCLGRPVEWYQEMLNPFELKGVLQRRIEPTYPVDDTGKYMLFIAPGAQTPKH